MHRGVGTEHGNLKHGRVRAKCIVAVILVPETIARFQNVKEVHVA